MINIKEIYTISNLLSLLRLFLAIPFWFLIENLNNQDFRFYTIGLCLFASITDILDGFIARRLNQITEFGKIIDPLADKICVATIIIKLYFQGEIDSLIFYFIISRDILIFIAGIIITKIIGKVLPSNLLGKMTVIVMCLFILAVLFQLPYYNYIYKGLYYSTFILVIGSLVGYGWRSYEFIKHKTNESI